MFRSRITCILFFGIFLSSCGLKLNTPEDGEDGTDTDSTTILTNVSSSHLPDGLSETTLKAEATDLDGDNDLDLVLAIPFKPNKILINDGQGHFSDESSPRLPASNFESRDIVITDFNGDNNQDLFFVSGQNQSTEFYINDGNGNFSNFTNRIPVAGNSTSAAAFDANGDGPEDVMIGNIGQNILLINNGNAAFTNQTVQRLSQTFNATQDIAYGDLTGDNLPDIIIANEEANQLFINTRSGFFINETNSRLPFIKALEESQNVNLIDVEGDDDLDIYFGNSGLLKGSNPQDRLLINDGRGFFSDQTTDRLPTITSNTFATDFADLDADTDPDIIVGNYNGGIRVLLNNGNGFFTDQSGEWIPENFSPQVNDIEIADYNADGLFDIYIAVRDRGDQLLLQ